MQSSSGFRFGWKHFSGILVAVVLGLILALGASVSSRHDCSYIERSNVFLHGTKDATIYIRCLHDDWRVIRTGVEQKS